MTAIEAVSQFHIKPGQHVAYRAIYFDDRPYAQSDAVHQPDAYALAGYLATRYGADTIIDIGCGSANVVR